MRQILKLVGMTILAVGGLAACQSAPLLPKAQPLPILAWVGPPADQTNDDRFRELADAGFNINFSGYPNIATLEDAMRHGAANGVRIMASCPELQSDPESTVARIKDNPGLAGYFLRDEPSADDFDMLGDWARRIQAVDRAHPCYINLFPTYANTLQLFGEKGKDLPGPKTYEEYVAQFLAKVPVPMLSFDNYPVAAGKIGGGWAHNLELISAAARKAGIPFWAFALSVAHGPHPIATVDHLRLQAFTNLAYGAKAIQYFTYWTPVGTPWDFHKAPIEADGTKTIVYFRVMQVNAELQAVWPAFAGSTVSKVGFIGGETPKDAVAFGVSPPIKEIATGGNRALVSLLENGPNEVLAIVNWELDKKMSLAVKFEAGAEVYPMEKDGTLAKAPVGFFGATIDPGDMRILVWKRNR